MTFSKSAHTGAYCCLNKSQEVGKVISFFKNLYLHILMCPTSALTSPTVTLTQMKRETKSRKQVDSLPQRPSGVTGAAQEAPLWTGPPGTYTWGHPLTCPWSISPCRAMGPASCNTGEQLGHSTNFVTELEFCSLKVM